MRKAHRRAESEALLSVFSNTRESRAQIVGRPGTDRPHAGTRGAPCEFLILRLLRLLWLLLLFLLLADDAFLGL